MIRSQVQGAQDLEQEMELGMVLELEYEAGGGIAEEQKGEGKA